MQTPLQNLGKKTRVLILGGLGALLLVGSVAALDAVNVIDIPGFKDKPVARRPTPGESTINYDPPTETELKETEKHKEELAEQMANDPENPSTGQKSVTPVVTSWGVIQGSNAVEVSGFVPGVIESTGTCTITLTREGVTRTAQSTATANAQNMSCGTASIPVSQLSKGTWKIVISYSSAEASGKSTQDVSVDIP